MNKDIMKGHWNEFKGQVKKQWGKLTDDQLEQMSGAYDELRGAIQKQYGYNQERTEQELKKFYENIERNTKLY